MLRWRFNALGAALLVFGVALAASAQEQETVAEEDVLLRHPAVGEADVHVTVGCVVAAEHVHRAQDLDAGRAHRNEDLRLLAVRRRIGPSNLPS